MNKCKDCVFFERMKWHKAVDSNEDYQLHGKCRLLKEALGLVNISLFYQEHLIVSEEFGCVLWRDKSEHVLTTSWE